MVKFLLSFLIFSSLAISLLWKRDLRNCFRAVCFLCHFLMVPWFSLKSVPHFLICSLAFYKQTVDWRIISMLFYNV